jgi:DNA-directed RNA polymerase specialized sigma subunit
VKPKEYLQQYRQSMERTAEIEQHLHELKAEAIRLKDHEGQSVKLDDATAKYVDACDEMSAELVRLHELREAIRQTIEAVPDARLRNMLTEIYMGGQTLVRIAADKNYSYEHICRLHGEALRLVSEIMPTT